MSVVRLKKKRCMCDRHKDESGLTKIRPGPEPEAAPSAQDTVSMEVESWVRQAGKVDKWIVQFFAPCLVQWKFSLPWVSPAFFLPHSVSCCTCIGAVLCSTPSYEFNCIGAVLCSTPSYEYNNHIIQGFFSISLHWRSRATKFQQ